MPWWWAMKARTTVPSARPDPRPTRRGRVRVRGACSRSPRRSRRRPRALLAARRRRFRTDALGIEHGRERGGVGGDHQLVAQAALQAQAGDAEGLVLVVVVPVHEVVGGLRDAPGHAAIRRVLDLAPHGHPAGLVEERLRIALHEEERHQVLEQGGAPRQQRGRPVHARDEPSEVEPVRLGQLALGDADEAREPRLRGQEVVVGGVQTARPFGVGEPVADGEDVPLRVVEEAGSSSRRRTRRRAGPGPGVRPRRRPSARVMSAPARLPLSTVDT